MRKSRPRDSYGKHSVIRETLVHLFKSIPISSKYGIENRAKPLRKCIRY